jgi:hypothetical protein
MAGGMFVSENNKFQKDFHTERPFTYPPLSADSHSEQKSTAKHCGKNSTLSA